MTESVKTLLFVAAAALSLVVAFVMGPTDVVQDFDALVGTRLNRFDLDVAKRLKIVKFDKETVSTREFEVAETDGLWSIPSKQGYPADAAQQMADAATCLVDREVLRVAGKTANDHETLGVIDPGSSKLDSKAEGIGTRVTITDSNDTPLADMIIGKPVKDAVGQYYVRNIDQDVVYVIHLDPSKLSTKFEDWIEDDLLKLNPQDIGRIKIKDYSAELLPVFAGGRIQMQVQWDLRGEMTLDYDSQESKWHAKLLQEADANKKDLNDYELAEDEELNEEALDDLRTALDDLLLVDVERKPAGLSAGLKGGNEFLKDRDAVDSLIARGFAPVPQSPDLPPEILSTEGEIVCTLQDGVEYVLRFGNLQVGEDGEAASNEKVEKEAKSGDGINRYLFVMARFNEKAIGKPELAELPKEEPKEEKSNEADPPPTPGESASADGDPDPDADGDPEADGDTEADQEALLAAHKMIKKENERRQNEYEENLQTGKDKVAELNERFGDWYYVISNDVYKKIHLGRSEVIQKKETEAKEGEAQSPPAGIPGLPNLPLGK